MVVDTDERDRLIGRIRMLMRMGAPFYVDFKGPPTFEASHRETATAMVSKLVNDARDATETWLGRSELRGDGVLRFHFRKASASDLAAEGLVTSVMEAALGDLRRSQGDRK